MLSYVMWTGSHGSLAISPTAQQGHPTSTGPKCFVISTAGLLPRHPHHQPRPCLGVCSAQKILSSSSKEPMVIRASPLRSPCAPELLPPVLPSPWSREQSLGPVWKQHRLIPHTLMNLSEKGSLHMTSAPDTRADTNMHSHQCPGQKAFPERSFTTSDSRHQQHIKRQFWLRQWLQSHWRKKKNN